MAKYEFISEFKPISEITVYYTNRDGNYVNNSLSHDKEKAYNLFLKASNEDSLDPLKTVIETIIKE